MKSNTYNRQDLLKELNLSKDTKLGDIKRKLDRLKIKYEIEGRGAAAKFHIELPTYSLSAFVKEHLRIVVHDEKKAAHLLLTLLNNDNLSYAPRTLEFITYSSRHTIEEWIKAMLSVNLLQKSCEVEEDNISYYAIHKEIINTYDDEMETYDYVRMVKNISKEDYQKATKIYHDTRNEALKDIETNPNMVVELANRNAAIARLYALEYKGVKKWIPFYRTKYKINEEWEFLSELKEILATFDLDKDYKKIKKGSFVKDMENREKQDAEIERLLEEKRKRLEDAATEVESAEIATEEDKSMAAAFADDNRIFKKYDDIPTFDSIYDKLLYLQNRYNITKKGELNCYED